MPALAAKDRLRSDVVDSRTDCGLRTPGTIIARRGHTAQSPAAPLRELLRVLIVDEYRASADTMSRLVAAWGHDIRRAYDGTTGLALAAAYQPDVLLLDISMFGVNGLELARQLGRQTHSNGCLITAVTGRTDEGHLRHCEEAGIDLFLIKPADLSFLRTLLAVESKYRLPSRQYTTARDVHGRKLRQRVANVYSPSSDGLRISGGQC